MNALTGLRILLVDDAPEVRMLLRVVLEDAGCLVEEAADGARGREAAGRLPDLVLLDVQLPDVDGPEMLADLRSDVRTAGVPVVFLTADVGRDSELVAAGAIAVLHKPVDLTTFTDRLAELMAGVSGS